MKGNFVTVYTHVQTANLEMAAEDNEELLAEVER